MTSKAPKIWVDYDPLIERYVGQSSYDTGFYILYVRGDLYEALEAENERLTAELDELDFLRHEGGLDSVAGLETRVKALEAENERLRMDRDELAKALADVLAGQIIAPRRA